MLRDQESGNGKRLAAALECDEEENDLVYEVVHKAEAFADCMKRQCRLNYEDADLGHIEEILADVRRILRSPDSEHLRQTNPKELQGYIARTNPR